MRRLTASVALACACALPFAVAGCGGDDPLGKALGYLPEDAPFVAAIDTDVEGDQYRSLDRIVERFPFGDDVKRGIQRSLEEGGLDFEEDVKPLLGNPLVLGTPDVRSFLRADEQLVGAIQAKDEGKLEDFIEKQDAEEVGEKEGATIYRDDEGDFIARDGDVVVFADSRELVEAALERSGGDDSLEEETFTEPLEGMPDDALARVYADVQALLRGAPDAREARKIEWVDALRTLGLAASVERDRLRVDFNLVTEPEGLTGEDLPLAPGEQSPGIVRRPGEISLGVRDPSQIVDFAEQAAQAVSPEDFRDFQTAKRQIEQRLGVDIDKDIVGQLTGELAANVTVDGKFGIRSEVRDPRQLERTLARVARAIPRVARAQGLGIVAVEKRGDFYAAAQPDGDSVVFGVVDDVFVLSNQPARAGQLATESPSRVSGARGALVLSADAEKLADELLSRLAPQLGLGALGGQLFTRPLGELTGSVTADTDGLRGRLVLGFD